MSFQDEWGRGTARKRYSPDGKFAEGGSVKSPQARVDESFEALRGKDIPSMRWGEGAIFNSKSGWKPVAKG